jgi:hypothetical protein
MLGELVASNPQNPTCSDSQKAKLIARLYE